MWVTFLMVVTVASYDGGGFVLDWCSQFAIQSAHLVTYRIWLMQTNDCLHAILH
jgi:hypothetical protein